MNDIALTMPDLAEAGEAVLARWSIAVGDAVAAGQILAEAETDKASFEIEAPVAGTFAEIVVDAGQSAAPGAIIGRIRSDS